MRRWEGGKINRRESGQAGFTILEILTVIVIIGLVVTGVAFFWHKVTGELPKDIKAAAVLSDMRALKEAIVNNFYPDTGLVPCAETAPATSAVPEHRATEYTSLYLGLTMDCDANMLKAATVTSGGIAYILCEQLRGNCRIMCEFLSPLNMRLDGNLFLPADGFVWNEYYAKGWRGSYMACNARYDATAFDPQAHPADGQGNPVYLPAMETPYVDECEALALAAEADGRDYLAFEYRRGKYYHIMGTTEGSLALMSRGPDCLPAPAGIIRRCIRKDGDKDCPAILGFLQSCLEASFELCKSGCLPESRTSYRASCDYADYVAPCWEEVGHHNNLEHTQCVKKSYKACVNCTGRCTAIPCLQRFRITDPDHPGYIDLEDDTVMMVFSGLIRSPLEKRAGGLESGQVRK